MTLLQDIKLARYIRKINSKSSIGAAVSAYRIPSEYISEIIKKSNFKLSDTLEYHNVKRIDFKEHPYAKHPNKNLQFMKLIIAVTQLVYLLRFLFKSNKDYIKENSY